MLNLINIGHFHTCFAVSPRNIVQTTPSSISVTRRDDVSFTCNTDAGPDTLFLWLYNIRDLACTDLDCSNGGFALSDDGRFS